MPLPLKQPVLGIYKGKKNFYTYIIVILNKLDNVGGVISQHSDSRPFNDVTEAIIDFKLILCNCKNNADCFLLDLVYNLAD